MVSNSRRTPEAAPASVVQSAARSPSKKLVGGLGHRRSRDRIPRSLQQQCGDGFAPPRKGPRSEALIADPGARSRRRPLSVGRLTSAASLPASPQAGVGAIVARCRFMSSPSPGLRPLAHQLRADRHPLGTPSHIIVGILLGWLYGAARIIRRRAALERPPMPMTVKRLRRFRAVGHASASSWGGRIGPTYCSTNPGYFAAHPLESFQLWKGRHVVFTAGFSRLRCSRSSCSPAHRGLSILSLGDITCARRERSGFFSGRIRQLHQRRAFGAGRPIWPWGMVFPTGGPICRAIRASSTRRLFRGALAFCCPHCIDPRRPRSRRPGFILGAFSFGLRRRARSICEHFSRGPDAQLGFLWGRLLTMGHGCCRCH